MSDQEEKELSTAALFERYVIPNYARFPVAMERGEGTCVWDETGKKYLDFAAGVAVCSLGHCHPALTKAIDAQARKLIHCSNLYRNRGQAMLAAILAEEVVGAPGKSFFCNSGAEANEALIKLARKFGRAAPKADGAARCEIITFEKSFHGRTMAGISATGQAKVREGFDPLLPGFRHVPFNDAGALRAAVTADTAAILLEAVQGEGGINVATPEFLGCVQELCASHRLLLMMDEVQCGIGRTGDLCGWRSIEGGGGILPDAVSWAKGLGGGFPIGAVWVREAPVPESPAGALLCDLLGPGTHGSTFGGNPLACAAATAVLREILASRLPENARRLGEHLRREIASWGSGLIAEVRGLGLMIGIVIDSAAAGRNPGFVAEATTPALFVVRKLMERGLLTVAAGPQVVRLLPPLNVSRAEADEALAILRSVVEALAPLAPAARALPA